ncbi:MAG: hypothetical protein ABI305_07605, partial [Tepidiformaceae bacterium]
AASGDRRRQMKRIGRFDASAGTELGSEVEDRWCNGDELGGAKCNLEAAKEVVVMVAQWQHRHSRRTSSDTSIRGLGVFATSLPMRAARGSVAST